MTEQDEQERRESLARADAEARLAAKREFERPLALEAGAGTGKTATLVARVVCWSLGLGWVRAAEALRSAGDTVDDDGVASRVLEGVVAITFTEAAAAEMAQRCSQAFAQLARGVLPVGLSDGDDDWDYLASAGGGVERATVQARAGALLEAQEQLGTRTIHAFCRALLSRHPLEASLAPGFEVDADGSRAEALAREVLERALRTAWGRAAAPGTAAVAPEEDMITLLALGLGPPELEFALRRLQQLGARAADLDADPLAPEAVQAFVASGHAHLAALREAGLGRFEGAKLGRNKKTPLALEALAASAVLLPDPEREEVPASAEALTERIDALRAAWVPGALDRLRDWSQLATKGDPKSDAKLLDDLVPAFAQAAADLERWLRHALRIDVPRLAAARRVLRDLLAELEARMESAGVASFERLLSATRELLASHPGIRAEERGRLQLLLVDEFQDTDATQCAIVRALALDGGDPTERPALFLVGDPKQSIYGWRRADLSAYEAFLDELSAHGGTSLPLAVNFRSVPAVLDEVQRLVDPVMVATPGLQPEFQPLLPRPGRANDAEALPGDRAHVEHWVSWAPGSQHAVASRREQHPDTLLPGGRNDATFTLEARALARDLLELGAEGLPWSKVAILVRATTSLEPYLDALRQAGIPFSVRGDKNYYRRREVVDAIALVRTVLDPNDHLGLVTLLRSPWVGVPDAALAPLFAADAPALFARLDGSEGDAARVSELRSLGGAIAARLEGIPGLEPVRDFEHALAEVARALGVARHLFETAPADRFVEGLRTLFQPEPAAAARFQGAWRLPNLARFFRELLDALDGGAGGGSGLAVGDAHAVLRRLRRDLADRREAEEARPQEDGEEAVQVLTIHRSKGLDFEHVYLPQLHKGQRSGGAQTFALEHVEGRAAYTLFGAPTLDFDRVERRAARTEAAERVRLLYVATTRAERRLVLMSDWPSPSSSESGAAGGRASEAWERAANFAQLLPHRAGGLEGFLSLRALLDGDEDAQHSVPEEGRDAVWRFCARYGDPERIEALSRTREDVDRVSAAARLEEQLEASARLARQRPEAGPLAARPFVLRASEDGGAARAERAARVGAEDQDQQDPHWDRTPVDPSAQEVAPFEAEAARLAGTALHAALEALPLDTPPEDAAGTVRDLALQALPRLLPAGAPDSHRTACTTRVEELCTALEGGALLGRLLDGEVEVLARELPLVSAPRTASAPGAAEGEPVGYVVGAVDLLLREPGGGLVVVDHKSDHCDPAESRAAAERHAGQLARYAEAVAAGLQVDPTAIGREVWLLALDRVERL